MIQLSSACFQILNQLESVVEKISPEDFCRPSTVLSGSTIGQHLRHTLEFFICLERGFNEGTINYDKRAHDKQIETDKTMAIFSIGRIRNFIDTEIEDRPLNLEVCYEPDSEECTIATTYYRELTYNVEHAVHHMAIMKIGIKEIAPYVELPDHFGVAVSTVRYRETVLDSQALVGILDQEKM